MGTVQVQLNLVGLNVLMKSDVVQKIVDREGEAIQAVAGPNFEYTRAKHDHPWVARGYVQPKNAAGRREEAISKRLTRAVKRGGS